VSFLWHFPAGFPGSALPTTLPCDVRTFLEGGTSATAWPATEKVEQDMYDVIYNDSHGDQTPLAEHLAIRSDAAELARREAAARGAGRLMLPGTSTMPLNCVCVVPTPPVKTSA
jgi:hypothetical protein